MVDYGAIELDGVAEEGLEVVRVRWRYVGVVHQQGPRQIVNAQDAEIQKFPAEYDWAWPYNKKKKKEDPL